MSHANVCVTENMERKKYKQKIQQNVAMELGRYVMSSYSTSKTDKEIELLVKVGRTLNGLYERIAEKPEDDMKLHLSEYIAESVSVISEELQSGDKYKTISEIFRACAGIPTVPSRDQEKQVEAKLKKFEERYGSGSFYSFLTESQEESNQVVNYWGLFLPRLAASFFTGEDRDEMYKRCYTETIEIFDTRVTMSGSAGAGSEQSRQI